jgi:hypothetical protein
MVKLVGKILKVFADNNLFDEGAELIGSWCFKLYQKHLGVDNFPLRTPDIDFLFPTPFHGKEHPNFIKELENLGFEVDFKGDGSLYLWNTELKIEFMTTEKGRGTDKAIKIKNLGINAIPLRYVGFILEKPIIIVEDGVKVRVPDPGRFCLHKLIIASQRKTLDKSLKDLQQAIYTSQIVDKQEIQELFRTLPKKWGQSVLKMLEKAKTEFPLLNEEIEELIFTLQNARKLKK